jgi:glycine cleavage system H protein
VAYMEKFGEIESVKAVSELFSPVTGDVFEANEALNDNPQLVNESAYGEGWMLKVRLTAADELEKLLSAEQYDDFLVSEPE